MSVILADYIRHLETKRRAPVTIADARRIADKVIIPALGSVPVDQLGPRQIDDLIRKQADLTPATVRRYIAVLSAALGLAVRNGYITSNPVARASLPSLPNDQARIPTAAEVEALVGAMPSPVWRMALQLAIVTGARRGEVCALRWSDVTDGRFHIRRSVYRLNGETVEKSTKGGRERVVGVEPAAKLLLTWQAWCMDRAASADVKVPTDGYVLSSWPDCSHPLNPDTLSSHVTRAAKDLGIRHVHLHSLRHLAATEMLAAGVDVRQVADTLGHADGGRLALQVYGHPTTDRQRAAAAAMGRVNRSRFRRDSGGWVSHAALG